MSAFWNKTEITRPDRAVVRQAHSPAAAGQKAPVLGADYNASVARGWESKSVEAQQAEAADQTARSQPRMGAEEAARWREKEKFRLARQSVLHQLEANPNPRHRKLLQDALAALNERLRQFET